MALRVRRSSRLTHTRPSRHRLAAAGVSQSTVSIAPIQNLDLVKATQ